MISQFTALLLRSDAFLLGAELPVTLDFAPVTGAADNEVVRLSWLEGGKPHSTRITEDGLAHASFDEATRIFKVTDFEGHVLSLELQAKVAPDTNADPSVFLVVQEGGSSMELYLHVHDTLEAAEEDRRDCAVDGSYRTSSIVQVPRSLTEHPKFYDIAEQLVRASLTLDYPE